MAEHVHIATEEQRTEFLEKLSSPDYFALEHTITFKAVEFVPYKEFRNKKIKADDFHSEHDKYIEKHATDFHNDLMNFKSIISEKGLYVTMCSQKAKRYNPLLGVLEQLKEMSPEKAVETFKTFIDEHYCEED